jgi:two-component system, cell cycle response regulator
MNQISDVKSSWFDLSLEVTSAPDRLSAISTLSSFLKRRLRAERVEEQGEGSPSEVLPKGHQEVLLPFVVPVRLVFRSVSAEPLAADELEALGKITKACQDKLQLISELRGLTYTDDLTGLYNQRYLEIVLERELSLAKRKATEFSVLFLDLDHFKNVNDSHGHLIGSRLLLEVGQEIKKALRESDVTFRYGGDEFVMILAHTGLADAILVAERVRVQIEKKRFLAREGMDIRLTASIGVAAVPEHAATKEQILQAADEALYGVKKAVRNKVIAATRKLEG